MLDIQEYKWLEDNGLAIRTSSTSIAKNQTVHVAQIVFKQRNKMNDYDEWARGEHSIEGVACKNAFDAAVRKGPPPTPEQAYNQLAAKDAEASRKIAEMEAKIKELEAKASAPAPSKPSAKP